MIRLSLSKGESFLLVLALESFLLEASGAEAEALESLLIKAQRLSPSAPFRSAAEARKRGFHAF